MNRSHEAFFRTPVGIALEELLRRAHHILGYAIQSLAGEPAIGGAMPALDAALERLQPSDRGHAKQSCGALVGEIVEKELRGHRALTRNGRPKSARVKNSVHVTRGAVWIVSREAALDAEARVSARTR